MLLTAGATVYAPKTRAPIYEPHGMTWPEFRGDLRRREAFRRTVRMSEASFVKLADLLRPAIQKNERFGSEYHVMCPGIRVRSLSSHPKAVLRFSNSFKSYYDRRFCDSRGRDIYVPSLSRVWLPHPNSSSFFFFTSLHLFNRVKHQPSSHNSLGSRS